MLDQLNDRLRPFGCIMSTIRKVQRRRARAQKTILRESHLDEGGISESDTHAYMIRDRIVQSISLNMAESSTEI